MTQEFRVTDRQIITTRTLAHPIEKVWHAWTDPDTIVRFWGPDGFTTTIHHCDMRPGGTWCFTMHAPDGTDMPNEWEFTDVIDESLIGYRHLTPPHFEATVEFIAEDDGATTVRMVMTFETKEQRDAIAVYAEPANEQQFDRLTSVLAS